MENIQHDYFIWEEKNLIDQNQNSLKNEKFVKENSIIETKNDLTQKDWKDITDPKLRRKIQKKTWRENNKEKISVQKKNWDKIHENERKAYREDNKEKIKIKQKIWRDANKETRKVKRKIYRETNKNKIKVYNKSKYKNDIQYKLSRNLRGRLYKSINGNFKVGSAVRDLGCSVEQLKQHLESKFLPGMSWDNWAHDGWHIDHIKPLDSFDLTDRNQLLEACHYTNLQPLWAKDNLVKSNKLI